MAQQVAQQGSYQQEIIQALPGISSNLDNLHLSAPASAAVSMVEKTFILITQPESSTSISLLHLLAPPQFDGDPKACEGIINQCTIHFELCP